MGRNSHDVGRIERSLKKSALIYKFSYVCNPNKYNTQFFMGLFKRNPFGHILFIKKFLINLITSNTGVSSKRVAGLIGWLVILFISVWCTIKVIQAPSITNELLWGSVTLLGVDSITKIWRKKPENNDEVNSEIGDKNKEEE